MSFGSQTINSSNKKEILASKIFDQRDIRPPPLEEEEEYKSV